MLGRYRNCIVLMSSVNYLLEEMGKGIVSNRQNQLIVFFVLVCYTLIVIE